MTSRVQDLEDEMVRRVVLCVRACRGIPTEALEDGAIEKLRETAELFLERLEQPSSGGRVDVNEELEGLQRAVSRAKGAESPF